MGRVLRVAHGKARTREEARVRRHEQGRRERIRLDDGEPRQSFLHLRRQSGDSSRSVCEASRVGEERCRVAERMRQRGLPAPAPHVAD